VENRRRSGIIGLMSMGTGRHIRLTVNNAVYDVADAHAPSLLQVLRNHIGLNGPKYGCGLGQCGACLVLVDGKAARSCVLPPAAVVGKQVTTLEGLGSGDTLHPVQQAFIEEQGAQCGYCLNGMIIRTVALLKAIPAPSEQQIREALRFNLCRCGTHQEILASVRKAVTLLAEAPK
jgi:nicotinate dehydrogenase subunit A